MSRTWPVNRTVWEAQIEPLVGKIVEIRYDYPVEQDVWKNDIEPLLLQYDVDLVHTGHSHLWNRAEVGGLNYIETSNVGNSFGAYFSDDGGPINERTGAGSFRNELAQPDSRWDPADYPRTGDPHGREPAFPTAFNPMFAWDGAPRPVPYINSNNVTAFTIFDSATGAVTSYAFDTRLPESEVVKFDEFFLDPVLLLNDGAMFDALAGAEVSGMVNITVAPLPRS
ncbi:MAG: hypothetical protein HC822_09050, partial [Oscillochloris sp.]|nr:hypothetical protein [Oscillochloris sp.]